MVSIASPPEKREHYETGYIFVRPSGYDLGEHIAPLVAEGNLRPTIAGTFPLAETAAAQTYMEERRTLGKVLLVP